MFFSIRKKNDHRERLLETYSKIRHAIVMSGISKEELAVKTGISARKIYSIMMFGRIPTLDELVRLADALDLEIILASGSLGTDGI